jgi:L-lysine exporter family protein LysE/ArgO
MNTAAAVAAGLAGFGLGASLIIAIGAQNAFVLRQGVRRQHVGIVIAICIASDVVLIALGVAGAGALFTAVPWLVEVARWAGAAFLLLYAALATRRAIRPAVLAVDETARPVVTAGGVALTCLALTWLNPHVYLDTLVLLGSVASTHGEQRWAFGAGAAVASAVWFTLLGLGARALAPLFAKPLAWRVLDGVIAAIMVVVAVSLVLPVLV